MTTLGFLSSFENFDVKGNLSVFPDDFDPANKGDGSIEASGTLYINTINNYTPSNGILLENSFFSNTNSTLPNTLITNSTFSNKSFFINSLDINSKIITNMTSPTNPLDSANKFYVDSSLKNVTSGGTGNTSFSTGTILIGNGTSPLSSFSSFYFLNNTLFLTNPSNATNLTTSTFVISGGISVNGYSFFNGLDNNKNVITNVTSPTNSLDVANKFYVDNKAFTSGNTLILNSTLDSISYSSGGTFTSLGGGSFSKTLFVGNNLNVGSNLFVNNANLTPNHNDLFSETLFNPSNNQITPANITGLFFNSSTTRSFTAWITLTIYTTTGIFSSTYFELKGIQKNSIWTLNRSYIGDFTLFNFSISNTGQLLYTSPNILTWTSTTLKFRALTSLI